MKKNLIFIQINKFTNLNNLIIGKIKAISTSKIKKIIVIKKKCKEKGIRAEDLGSNPHSNGEFFSRSIKDFFDKIIDNIIIILEIKIINIEIINIKMITYIKFFFKLFDWKSNILIYINKINYFINKKLYKEIIKWYQ